MDPTLLFSSKIPMMMPRFSEFDVASSPLASQLRVGFDLVKISGITDSVNQFGDRFIRRIFTSHELEYALNDNGLRDERLAARFAAKEAAIKALRLSNVGIGWRDIEVCKLQDGDCALNLYGRVRQLADAMKINAIALSISHDGGYAGAIVTVLYGAADMNSDQLT